MLLLRSEILSAAILFRAMVPLVPEVLPNLTDKRIFMSSGLHDPIVPKREVESLSSLFKKVGAEVSLYWQNSGHELRIEEVKKAKAWLNSSF
jgi:predicted esterase